MTRSHCDWVNMVTLYTLLGLMHTVLGMVHYCEDGRVVEIAINSTGRIVSRHVSTASYTNNMHCAWLIDAGQNNRVQVRVLSSDLQWAPSNAICTGYDYMQAIDYGTRENKVLHAWCNDNTVPGVVTSTGRYMRLTFSTNSQNPEEYLEYGGVELEYSAFVVDECPAGWMASGDHCYYSDTAQVTWQKAREDCNYAQANLPMFLVDTQWNEFLNIAENLSVASGAWIGLRDEDGEGSHHWLDNVVAGAEDAIERWDPSIEPVRGADCVVVALTKAGWSWQPELCDTPNTYVCKMHKSCPQWIKTSGSSALLPGATTYPDLTLEACKYLCAKGDIQVECKAVEYWNAGSRAGDCVLLQQHLDIFGQRTLTENSDIYELNKCVTQPVFPKESEDIFIDSTLPTYAYLLIITGVVIIALAGLGTILYIFCYLPRKKQKTQSRNNDYRSETTNSTTLTSSVDVEMTNRHSNRGNSGVAPPTYDEAMQNR